MTLWIGNGAVLKSSSQCAIKRILKINNPWTELSIFSKFLCCHRNVVKVSHNKLHKLTFYRTIPTSNNPEKKKKNF